MSTTLKIKVTKEILEKSKDCSVATTGSMIGEHCAIALAIKDIFPFAYVFPKGISVDGYNLKKYFSNTMDIFLPEEATQFIKRFDALKDSPKERMKLPEIEFEISIPDAIINKISIDELKPLLVNHPTLELINA